jgi:hypothetical protein
MRSAVKRESGPQAICPRSARCEGKSRLQYHSARFHAEDEGIGDHIPRVGQGVLLPQLAEEVGPAGHAAVVEDEVALEENVDGARCGWRLGFRWTGSRASERDSLKTNHNTNMRSARDR